MAFDLTPSSSKNVARLSIPVSRRRILTSGDNLGIVLPRARRIKDRISTAIPMAISQLKEKTNRDAKINPAPMIMKPSPVYVYGFI
ncbi:hypothetical protein ACFLUX_02725 [Chloroflexota bacterium]